MHASRSGAYSRSHSPTVQKQQGQGGAKSMPDFMHSLPSQRCACMLGLGNWPAPSTTNRTSPTPASSSSPLSSLSCNAGCEFRAIGCRHASAAALKPQARRQFATWRRCSALPPSASLAQQAQYHWRTHTDPSTASAVTVKDIVAAMQRVLVRCHTRPLFGCISNASHHGPPTPPPPSIHSWRLLCTAQTLATARYTARPNPPWMLTTLH